MKKAVLLLLVVVSVGVWGQIPEIDSTRVKADAGVRYLDSLLRVWYSYIDTAYDDRLKWDGGATGLTAATGRTSLGAVTLGSNIFTIANYGGIGFIRTNADNTVTVRSVAEVKTDLGFYTAADTSAVISTYAALRDTAAAIRADFPVGGGSGDLAYADTVSGTGFIETQFRVDTAKENIRGEIAAIEVGEAQMVYPESQGIAIMGAATWGTSITDNSTNWNTAYGWGDHGSEGYMVAADFHDSINEYFSDAVVAVAVEDSGVYDGGYISPTMLDNALAEFTPSNFDSVYLHYRIDSLAAVVSAQQDTIDFLILANTNQGEEIQSLWDAIETLGAGDLVAPRFSSASVRNDTLWITWDKSDVNTDSIVNVANIVLTEDDVTFGITSIIYESDSILVAKLDSASAYGSVYLVDHVRENGYPQLQDTSGNKTANFTDRAVTNLNSDPLADNTAPVFQSAFTYSDSIIAAVANENFHQDSIPPVGSITVTEDATTFGIAGVTISGDTLFIAGDSTFLYGTAILWDYDNSTYPQLQDSAENVVASLTDSTVTNTLPDLSNMIVNGTFADSSYWERREGFVHWVITPGSPGYATFDDVAAGILEQPDSVMTASVQPSTAYTLTFDLTGTSGGGIYLQISSCDDGEGSVTYDFYSEYTNGAITIQFTTPADVRDGGISFQASPDGDSGGTITNITLTAD